MNNLGALRDLALADAGYRSEENLRNTPVELVVALGREGKRHAEIDGKQYPYTATLAAKLKTDEGKAAYRKRKLIAEPPNGWIKSVLGFRQFSMRGLLRLQAEWKLVCTALNLRRMASMAGQTVRKSFPDTGNGLAEPHQHRKAVPCCDEPGQTASRSTSNRPRRGDLRLRNLCRAAGT